MGSQNTDILDQVGPLSRSGAAEVLLSINAPHCWLAKKLQKHLDCTLKSLSHHRGSHTEASASFLIPALCVTSKVTNKCYSLA